MKMDVPFDAEWEVDVFLFNSIILLELFKLETCEESVKNMLANASIL